MMMILDVCLSVCLSLISLSVYHLISISLIYIYTSFPVVLFHIELSIDNPFVLLVKVTNIYITA